MRRSVYEKYGGFDPSYGAAADVELMMRFLEVENINTRYIPETWVKMRCGGETNSSFYNIVLQNISVLRALRDKGLRVNLMSFLYKKFSSRLIQFFAAHASK